MRCFVRARRSLFERPLALHFLPSDGCSTNMLIYGGDGGYIVIKYITIVLLIDSLAIAFEIYQCSNM